MCMPVNSRFPTCRGFDAPPMAENVKPRDAAEVEQAIKEAIARYAAEVRGGAFPDEAHSFALNDEVLNRLR